MKPLLTRSALATGAALVLNVALFLVGAALGASYVVPDDMAGDATTTLTVVEIGLGTIVPMVCGVGLWLGLRRFAWGFSALVALVALTVVLSLVPFAGNWEARSKLFLGLMHFTTPVAFLVAAKPRDDEPEPRPH